LGTKWVQKERQQRNMHFELWFINECLENAWQMPISGLQVCAEMDDVEQQLNLNQVLERNRQSKKQ
jgi:hypothetical protein